MKLSSINLGKKANLSIIAITLFLTTVIGVTYAFIAGYLSPVRVNMNISSASLVVTFIGTSDEINADLAPGESVTKTFEVYNGTEVTQNYALYWKDVENTLADKNYFMYTITNVDTGEEIISPKYLPTRESDIISNVEIPGSTTQHYSLTITYVNDPKYNQLQNADLYFSGKVFGRSSNTDVANKLSNIFVNGSSVSSLPSLSSYSIDTTRTYCTDGSTISKVSNNLSISNLTDATTCEVYLISSSASAISDSYNLLVVELDDDVINPEGVVATGYHFKDDIVYLGEPLKSTKVFAGWTVTGATLIDRVTLKMGTTYAHAVASYVDGFTITYNNNGGSGCSSKSITGTTVLGELCVPTRSGYAFDGWYTSSSGGTLITSESTLQASTTIFAHWSQQFVVTYNCNGGNGTPPANALVNPGANADVSSKPCGYKVVTESGSSVAYYQTGWSTSDSGTATANIPITEPTTLYATWAPTVTYNGSYATTDDGSGNWSIGFTESGTITIPVTQVVDIYLLGGGQGGYRGSSGGYGSYSGTFYRGGAGGQGGFINIQYGVTLTAGTYTVTIGQGGAAGNGNVGGTTSFGTYQAPGGGSGATGYLGGAAGGIAGQQDGSNTPDAGGPGANSTVYDFNNINRGGGGGGGYSARVNSKTGAWTYDWAQATGGDQGGAWSMTCSSGCTRAATANYGGGGAGGLNGDGSAGGSGYVMIRNAR